jgi:hypothetical protein
VPGQIFPLRTSLAWHLLATSAVSLPKEQPMPRTLFALAAALALAGCGGVVCEHPASDDATTVADERLIGFWRFDPEASLPKEERSRADSAILVVGRKAGSEGEMEVVSIELREDRTVSVSRHDLRTTTIAGRPVASVSVSAAEEGTRWSVVRYDASASAVRVVALDEKAVAAQVRAGSVPGKVEETLVKGGPPIVNVALTAPTPDLRAWLEGQGDAVFPTDRALALRRLPAR